MFRQTSAQQHAAEHGGLRASACGRVRPKREMRHRAHNIVLSGPAAGSVPGAASGSAPGTAQERVQGRTRLSQALLVCAAAVCALLGCLSLLPGTAAALDATYDPSAALVTPDVSSDCIPVGTVITWPVLTSPADADRWLDCDGRQVQAADYPELVRVLSGSASATSVTLPNYAGLFLRGFGAQTHTQQNGTLNGVTSTRHISGSLGAVQGDSMRNITGNLPIGNNVNSDSNKAISGAFTFSTPANAQGFASTDANNVRVSFNAALVVPTASENRPVNTAVRYLIRAR